MFKSVAFLYIILFSAYLVFTREPDFIDGVKASATILSQYDAATKADRLKAQFSNGKNQYSVSTDYPLRNVLKNEQVKVIYEPNNPEKAVVYAVWGYWIRWDELLISLIGYFGLFWIAVSITSNPTPEALIEELEGRKPKKRKLRYD